MNYPAFLLLLILLPFLLGGDVRHIQYTDASCTIPFYEYSVNSKYCSDTLGGTYHETCRGTNRIFKSYDSTTCQGKSETTIDPFVTTCDETRWRKACTNKKLTQPEGGPNPFVRRRGYTDEYCSDESLQETYFYYGTLCRWSLKFEVGARSLVLKGCNADCSSCNSGKTFVYGKCVQDGNGWSIYNASYTNKANYVFVIFILMSVLL